MGQSFFKLTVHSNSKIMAVVNQDEETILLDTTELFNINKNAVETTVEMKKEKWLWPYKNRKTNADLKLNSCKILGKVTPPSGLVVSCLQFSLKGLFVFYCILGQSKCSSFKVIDECSAIVLYTFDGLVESKVICGGPLPLVMTDSILSICLGVLCNDYFIIKLCEAIPSFGFSKELERTLFSQSWNGALQFHLVFLEIIFHLHVNVFNSSLKSLIVKKTDDQNVNFVLQGNFSEKKIIEKVHELFKVVLDYKDNRLSSDFGIKQMMLVRCFLHAVHILDITQVETRGILDSGLFSSLLKQIVILFENVEIEDPLKNDWITWLEMTDTEIIREAVVVGAVALAHVFFVTKRNWPVDEVENKFKAEAHAWIVELVLFNDLEKAKLALDNLVSL